MSKCPGTLPSILDILRWTFISSTENGQILSGTACSLHMFPANHLILVSAAALLPALLVAQTPTVHVLPATPSTVAYGYYSLSNGPPTSSRIAT